MTWVKAIVVAVVAAAVFGGGAYFTYRLVIAPERAIEAEIAQRANRTSEKPPDPSLGEYEKAAQIKKSGDLLAARDAYLDFLDHWPDSGARDRALDDLGEIHTQMIFSKFPSPEKSTYVVRPGDSLVRIAAKTRTTPELIMRLNNLSGILINVGDELMIIEPNFSLQIDQAARTVTLLNRGRFFKRYRATAWEVAGKPKPKGTAAKVVETSAWLNGERVAFGAKNYADGVRWVGTTAGVTLYSDAPPGETAISDKDKPGNGIALRHEDMLEIAALVRRGTAVTFQ